MILHISSYQPAPFFVLDEVDAALDNTNVAKVANYIRSQASDTFQFIVISLKGSLYERGHSLVGIYRDQEVNSSRTLTLDVSSSFLWSHKILIIIFQNCSLHSTTIESFFKFMVLLLSTCKFCVLYLYFSILLLLFLSLLKLCSVAFIDLLWLFQKFQTVIVMTTVDCGHSCDGVRRFPWLLLTVLRAGSLDTMTIVPIIGRDPPRIRIW
jgi:glucan phosphoethanolaminetransferase (alkaline phosphatase superfamily)